MIMHRHKNKQAKTQLIQKNIFHYLEYFFFKTPLVYAIQTKKTAVLSPFHLFSQ